MLAQDANGSNYDFRFRGVLSILSGFPASSPSSLPTSRPNSRPGSRPGTPSRRKEQDEGYAAAITALLVGRKMERNFGSISGGRFGEGRRLAMMCCGADWYVLRLNGDEADQGAKREEDYEVVCNRFSKSDNYESAARHAFFSGHIERAMGYLRLCNEPLRLLAPVLAAYLAQKESSGTDSVFAELCRSLSSDGETPWVRGMFPLPFPCE